MARRTLSKHPFWAKLSPEDRMTLRQRHNYGFHVYYRMHSYQPIKEIYDKLIKAGYPRQDARYTADILAHCATIQTAEEVLDIGHAIGAASLTIIV